MAKSTLSPYHPKIAKKAFRANAKKEGTTFRAAAAARTEQLMHQKFLAPVRVIRRNPGRMDGFTWQGSTFISSQAIDGPTPLECDFDGVYHVAGHDSRPSSPDCGVSPGRRAVPVIHCLLDIARPAKRKGVAKEFEMIKTVRRVIMLEDDQDEGGDISRDDDDESWSEANLETWLEEDDEWEDSYIEHGQEKLKTYAAVLKEK